MAGRRTKTFGAALASVSLARRFACDEAAEILDEDDLFSLSLLTSELVTNAIIHGEGSVELALLVESTGVRVEVTDDSPHLPEVRQLEMAALGGRGLQLVAACAQNWGVDPLPDGAAGKTVWFTLP